MPALRRLLLGSLLLAVPWAVCHAADEPPPATDRLPPVFQEWLTEVAPLMAGEERQAFLGLEHDYQRRAFIERFWQVRDPFPQTDRNELRDRWEARVEEARTRFDSLDDARARMLLLHGPPGRVWESHCGILLRPVEAWYYARSDLLRSPFTLVFLRRGDEWELWHPSQGLASLLLGGPTDASPAAVQRSISESCVQGDDFLTMLADVVDWDEQVRRFGPLPPRPDIEWVAAFLERTTDLPADYEPLAADLSLRFPGRHQSRTVVQGMIRVPRTDAALSDPPARPGYSFLVDGEVLRQDQLFESFRYRFDLPEAQLGDDDNIPLLVERYLRPGPYRLIVRLEDLNGHRYFRRETDIDVPLVTASSAPPEHAVLEPTRARLREADAPLARGDYVLKLRPPPERLLTDKVRVEADAEGEGIARVRFELDGKPVLSKTRPPFSVELDLGHAPRVHNLRAVAEDAQGEVVATDEIALNVGPHHFGVRLVEPQAGGRYRQSLQARAVVDVPEGERLDRVELYLNDDLLATLYQPPFVQPLLLPESQNITYVRAAAYLVDGASAEDLVFINTPENLEQLDVFSVELYTTVLDRKGRPVNDLSADALAVYEGDERQQLTRFAWVEDLPIHAGILLDTSTSMMPRLHEAERAALAFFHKLITPRDRAAVVVFSDQPSLRVRFTNQMEVLAGGLAGLHAEGETALYDSLAYTLYYFSGIKGKRVLVLLSDGEDSTSRYGFEEVLDFARRSGVAIYCIGLDLSTRADEARAALQRLCEETGGRCFFISRASELEPVYDSIERELRSQYLLVYESSKTDGDDDFRPVRVEVDEPGLEANTIRGYYP